MINMQWYETLNKPFLNPPEWLFAPVWIFLYITIAISFILFIKDGMNRKKIIPLIFFIIQLALNIIWTPVFFGMENIIGGLIILVFLWIFLLLTIITFFRFSKAASLLLIPYIIWSSFAFYLNFGILVLN
ncbi:MAG: tryptophan-rich sensory protein [Candidatus Gastranaerophilales bacterium]|nr:tryptophan-rich sensory protein [Candidatus Gastranaerophilales bacterium]